MNRSKRLAFAALAALVLGAVAVAAVVHFRQRSLGGNAIGLIVPYRYAGTWVFDDAAVGLKREPFVAGIPEMIDDMVKDIPDAEQGFRLLFSAQPFPDYTHKLIWRRGDKTGNWYYSEQFDKEGWLCPGLFRYYREAPKEIYAKAERM